MNTSPYQRSALTVVWHRKHAPAIEELAQIVPVPFCCYLNAGLPNEMGAYDQGLNNWQTLRQYAEEGFINIIGGCCGTTPRHIGDFSCRF